ncbi:MAG: transcriptional regulator, AraC family [Mucilaginibacter sp.]|nr:transcriptional regulator, AraC family [Mucilaginibacter sp.]
MKSAIKLFVETAISNSFYITRLDNAALDTVAPNLLSYHRILLVEHGSGKLTVDDNTLEVVGQKMFLLAKGQVYTFHQPSIVTGYVLSFGDCFWEKAPGSASNCKAVLFNNAVANQSLQLTNSELSEFSFLFRTLFDEFVKTHYTNQMDALAAYLKIIMIKAANINITEEATFDSQDYVLYRKFLDLLSSQYKTRHEVSDYAKMLAITARRLSDLCKRCCNRTAKVIINGQLVAEAKRSLQFSSSPVKEIAYLLNFKSPEQFSHFFKKNTNFSPAMYRDHFVKIGA